MWTIDAVGELLDADRLAIRLDRERERSPTSRPAVATASARRLRAADVPRHDPLRVRQLVVIEERPQRLEHGVGRRRRGGLRLERRDAALDLLLRAWIACFAAIERLLRDLLGLRGSSCPATMYGASAALERLLEVREPAELARPLRRALPSRGSRRSSSSVSGMNAFVHASTAAVSVSMKFSSSGKGVPSP